MAARFDSTSRVAQFFLLVFSAVVLGSNSLATENHQSIGLNKFDLLKQYTGLASGGDGSTRYRKVTQAMGRKAIADARDAGVTYLRVAATGFAPSAYNRPAHALSIVGSGAFPRFNI